MLLLGEGLSYPKVISSPTADKARYICSSTHSNYRITTAVYKHATRPVWRIVVNYIAVDEGSLGFDSRAVKFDTPLPTARPALQRFFV